MHKLDAVIEPFHLLKHTFYQRWVEGRLSREELQRYAVRYYPHVEAFPTYVSAVHAGSDNLSMRRMLLENLIEEERGEENHPELWIRFGEALGLSRDTVLRQEPTEESRELVNTFRKLTRKSVASGLGALYAYESQVPAIAEKKIEGLKKHFGVRDERGLKFFSVHEEADKWHSREERDAIDSLSEHEQKEAQDAAKEASKALWNFLTALEKENTTLQAAS